MTLTERLFERDSTASIESELTQALQAVTADFAADFVPLRVALPDAAVRCATFALDAIPATETMRQELLRWRFSREMQRPEDSIVCVGQPAGSDLGKHLFFAQALDRNWLDCLRRSFERAGTAPWTLNSAASYRHNLHHDSLDRTGGALITVDPDSWGFQLWDSAKRLRYVRSRWRDSNMDYDLMSEEIERGIRAHSHSADGYQIERLYIAGVPGEVEELRGVLDRRLHQSISRLEVSVLPDAATDKQLEGALLLARTAATGYEDNN
ncbi:MAG: hypothetical protein ACM3W8_07425 [Sideroxydans sp.]